MLSTLFFVFISTVVYKKSFFQVSDDLLQAVAQTGPKRLSEEHEPAIQTAWSIFLLSPS